MNERLTRDNFVCAVAQIFAEHGGQAYLGEPVTMEQHMLQAAYLAEESTGDDLLVAAALLHDIGHFTGASGSFSMQDNHDRLHEQSGYETVKALFPDIVSNSVRWHVDAKRYLCATDPAYFGCLSKASRHSLMLQGGPMRPLEVEEFSTQPDLDTILSVRRWDDAAKIAGRSTPGFDHYGAILENVMNSC